MSLKTPTHKEVSSYNEVEVGEAPEKRKRGAFDIISDIISNIPSEGIRKTQLANKSLLDYRVFEKYLELMIRDGLVSFDKNTMKIYVTEHGLRFYQQWKALKELVRKTKI